MRSLGGALLVGGTLLAVTPAAMAATSTPAASAKATPQAAAAALTPPTLTSATISPSGGGEVVLLWTPPADASNISDYAIYANGKFVFRTLNSASDPASSVTVFLASERLTGKETFTVVSEDKALDQSAPSNGLAPVPPAVLPTPTMTSAVIHGDTITLSWTPSHTSEVSGTLYYEIDAGGQYFATVKNVTTVTLPVLFDDPIEPYVVTPGTLMTVHARDLTFFSMSPVSNALPATQG